MRILITILAAIFFVMSPGNAQERLQSSEKIQKAASESLATFGKLITKENYRQMGFESPGEVHEAKLGRPFQNFMVKLDQLQKYQKGSDPNKLLTGGNQLVYPILVKGQVRSSITIGEVNGDWKAESFGGPSFIKLLTKVQKKVSEIDRLPLSAYFVVRVPALNLYFIGYRIDNKLMLTPLHDDPGFKFKSGISMSADKVFTAILPAAKKHDGLPR